MNFIMGEMTFLRYFIPLIVEGNKRGIKSNLYIRSNQKYTNPYKFKKDLMWFSEKFQCNLLEFDKLDSLTGISFLVEGVDVESLPKDTFKISLTYMTDTNKLYKAYVDHVDAVVFPSKSFLDLGGLQETDKNVCLGSPKYDIVLDKSDCMKKYGISEDQKYALIMYPRQRDISKFPMVDVISSLKEIGYVPIIKTRGKDPCTDTMGCLYFEDFSWFPHTTMELIECSDIVINSGSTTIKEIVMMKKPVINFDIKPFHDQLSFFYGYDFAFSENNISMSELQKRVLLLTSYDWKHSFDQCIKDYLFEGVGTSARILDYYREYL